MIYRVSDGGKDCPTCGGSGRDPQCVLANEELGHECSGCDCPDCGGSVSDGGSET